MTVRYYTREWISALAERMATPEFEKQAEKLHGIVVFRVFDCPGGLDRTAHWDFENGKVLRWSFEEQPAPWSELRDAPFHPNWVSRISCPYDMLAKINRGEMTPMRALTSSSYHIEGKKVQILKMIGAVAAWNELAASIPTEYE
jgi:hypothetical protein